MTPQHDEMTVHVPCGRLRGPVPLREWPELAGRRQRCACEPGERWAGYDVSRALDLCVLCLRDTAGGPTRWAWLACRRCRTVHDRASVGLGVPRLFPLGRHSIMNGAAVSLAESGHRLSVQQAALVRPSEDTRRCATGGGRRRRASR